MSAPHCGNAEQELAQFARERIDVQVLANQLQDEGAKSFVKSWNDLMSVIDAKTAVLKRAS
jgi:transaldolase